MARGGNLEEKGMCGDSGGGGAVTASPLGERAARRAVEVSSVSGHKVPQPKGHGWGHCKEQRAMAGWSCVLGAAPRTSGF